MAGQRARFAGEARSGHPAIGFSMGAVLFFEDFVAGQKLAPGSRYRVTAEEIAEFARDYDPQPHHLDDDFARTTVLGGIAASGWHVCAMAMRLIVDGLIAKTACAGGAGVEECRWLKPVRPGDELRVEVEVLETSVPQSRPDIGFVKWRWDVFNQESRVATILTTAMFERRT
jgi:acyl dehydratase